MCALGAERRPSRSPFADVGYVVLALRAEQQRGIRLRHKGAKKSVAYGPSLATPTLKRVPKEHPVSSVTNERRLSFAAGIVYGSQEAQISDLMALAKKAQASFEETKAFWN